MILNRYFTLIALFVTTAHSLPQGNLAPATIEQQRGPVLPLNPRFPILGLSKAIKSHAPDAHSLHMRQIHRPSPSVSVNPPESHHEPLHESVTIHNRQLHNADYGSGNGPSGNMKPPLSASETTSTVEMPQQTSDSKDVANSSPDNSSNGQKRREFITKPSDDINYVNDGTY